MILITIPEYHHNVFMQCVVNMATCADRTKCFYTDPTGLISVWSTLFCFQDDGIYQVSDADETVVRLRFVKFETKFIETCLDFIQHQVSGASNREKCIKVTGGGGYKYTDLVAQKLGVQ